MTDTSDKSFSFVYEKAAMLYIMQYLLDGRPTKINTRKQVKQGDIDFEITLDNSRIIEFQVKSKSWSWSWSKSWSLSWIKPP